MPLVVLVNGWVVAIADGLKVNGRVVAIPEILLVSDTVGEGQGDGERVRETDTVLVKGCVVAIPEPDIVKEDVCERVRVTEIVYEGLTVRVFN